MNILIGLLGAVGSMLLMIYRVPIVRFFGTFQWFEDKLGPGGTYTAMVIMGLVGFLVSLMIMTDTIGLLFGGFLNTFFGAPVN